LIYIIIIISSIIYQLERMYMNDWPLGNDGVAYGLFVGDPVYGVGANVGPTCGAFVVPWPVISFTLGLNKHSGL
jgi:hypothetical protein